MSNTLKDAQDAGKRDFAYSLAHDSYALCAQNHSLKGEIHFGGEALQNVDMMEAKQRSNSNIDFRVLQSGGRQ